MVINMSVHLSDVEFSPQFTDEDEAELEREEWEQQQKMKEFLDREIGDEIFEVSFASYHSQSNHSSEKSSKINNNGDTHILVRNESHTNGFQNGHYEPQSVSSINGMPNDQQNYHYSNGYVSSSTSNRKHANPKSPPQAFYNIGNHYNAPDGGYGQSMVPPNDSYQVDGKQYIEDSQLCVLYNARGKKIESMEIQIEEHKEKFSKEIRVLQHKLTMMTSEKDGLSSSFQQQQNILQEHKQQIALLEKQLKNEQEEKRQLDNQNKELNEKLYASDCAVDTLQQQIKQLNQTESMSRARAQHESMLGAVRQRHEEEILTLKEKLDDLQQALAWKTEDLNRYREMLDSNSSVSEIGILRNRLGQEEMKTKEVEVELEKIHKKYIESDEQLKLYEGLVKMQAAQLTSTPLNPFGAMMNKGEFDKTPLTTNLRSQEVNDSALGPSDTSFREELVKSLSINREKRQQISVLRDQLEFFQKQLHGKKNVSVEDRDVQTDAQTSSSCDQCKKIQNSLDEKIKEFEHLSITSKNEINQLLSDKAELKANMADMVKNFDKQKVSDMQNQNKATLQLIDDVKANLLKEIQKVHDEENKQLHDEIESLNGELLHTKEEYLKLCTEVKGLEDEMRKEFDVERKTELEELKQTLEIEYNNQLSKQEINLTNKYVEDLGNEKKEWKEENEKENADKIEKSVMLAKADWIESYNAKRGDNLSEKEKAEFIIMKEKCEKLEQEIKESETKCLLQQEDIDVQLEAAKVAWSDEQKTEMNEKIEDLRQNIISEEKEKMEADHQKAILKCNDKWEKEVKKLQTSLNEQTSLSKKINLDLKLKTALWNRTESEQKRKLESLQKEANKKCEKCQQKEEESENRSDSTQEKGMCAVCCVFFKKQETLWKSQEKELLSLLEEAQEQIKVKLGSLKNIAADPTASNNSDTSECGSAVQESKEIDYKESIDKMTVEVEQWKERYNENEKRIADLNNNIISVKDDIVFTESCYERQINTLQKQLAKTEENLDEAQEKLRKEKEKAKIMLEKCDLLERKKAELEKDVMFAKTDAVTFENKCNIELDGLQNEISNLKQTLSLKQNELAMEIEERKKLKIEYMKLSNTSQTDNRLNSLIQSKKKIVVSEYENKIEHLSNECNKWKLKYYDVEKENTELERNLQLQLSNVTKTESYFKKQLDTLQSEMTHLTETLSQVQNELCAEKNRSNKLDIECKQLSSNYNINLENVLNVEKQKWQIESAKLQEAVLKASEIDHNNFVKEIQSQTNHINEINKIKEEHDIVVGNLKQGFREKLARITEMKKKWIREEEEKRSQIEKKIKDKYAAKFSEIQEQHGNVIRDQQAHWVKEIHQSKKDQLSTLVGLREEVKMKDKLLLKERQTFEEVEASGKQKMKDLVTKHRQEVEKLKIEHLNNLQKEKRRLEQYFKMIYHNPMSISIPTKETKEVATITVENEKHSASITQEEFDCCEKTRQFYMETLERIQQDVSQHITTMRTNADIEMREAVERERKKIYQEMKTRERSITTSSPKMDKEEQEDFGSPTFTNSMINGSCMVFKDLPNNGS